MPIRFARSGTGIVFHRRANLDASELTRRDGIPVTTPVCTLIDLAPRLSREGLEAAINEADKRNLVDPEALRRALEGVPGRPGVAILREILDRHTFTLTDSALERRFLPIVRRAGLPRPLTQQTVNGFRVDFYWPDLGLVVETDGLRYHRTPAEQARSPPRSAARGRRPRSPALHPGAGPLRARTGSGDPRAGRPATARRSSKRLTASGAGGRLVDEFRRFGRSQLGSPATWKAEARMTDHEIGTREEWLAARRRLLEREKAHTREGDELARQRRELPWVPVEEQYRFETEAGTRTLAELFDGRSQLLVYHFMFGPDYEVGCPTCSSIADGFDAVIPHLKARDLTLACVSRAPLEKLAAYKRRLGWSFPWASSEGSDFNLDLGVSFTDEQLRGDIGIEYNYRALPDLGPILEATDGPIAELARASGTDPAGYVAEGPGLSAFALDDGVVYHTYSCFARGAEFLMGYYGLLDRAPRGRDEGGSPEVWIRRRDEYEDPAEASR